MDPRATPHDVFLNVRRSAEAELRRSSLGLAFSGLSAGLNIGFGFAAVAAITGMLEPPSSHIFGAVVYPVGFILVITARAQLFTEQTLTPVLLVLADPSRHNVFHTARLWVVVLAMNLLGAFIFSAVLAAFEIPPGIEPAWFTAVAERTLSGSWGGIFVRSILAGWLVALLVWMLHAGPSTLGDIVLVWITAFLIHLMGVTHSVAGAVEVLYLAHQGTIRYVDWLNEFQVPVTVGNALGGLVFVSLVNYAQVVGAGRDVEVAEEHRRIEETEIREAEDGAREERTVTEEITTSRRERDS